MDVWRRMIRAQGGDCDAALPTARFTDDVRASTAGVVTAMDAMAIGVASWRLGAGRARQGAGVQATAGIELLVRPGDRVDAGTPLLRLHTRHPGNLRRGPRGLTDAIVIGSDPPATRP